MSLFARADLMLVAIPVTSGGCGATHSRPVTHGAPNKTWELKCAPCESYLRGDKKDKIIRVIPGDKELQIPSRMEHIADTDPHWATTPEGVPPTPDEQYVNKIRARKGDEELSRLQALIAAKAAGIDVPANAMWLLEQTFDPRVIKGTVLCPDGHDNISGSKFCSTCAKPVGARTILQIGDSGSQEIDLAADGEGHVLADALPLRTLHVATLKKMCRDKGLSDAGKKEDLIGRLGSLCRELLGYVNTAEAREEAALPGRLLHGHGVTDAMQRSAKSTQ